MDERVDSFLTDIAVINGGNTRERLDIFVVSGLKLGVFRLDRLTNFGSLLQVLVELGVKFSDVIKARLHDLVAAGAFLVEFSNAKEILEGHSQTRAQEIDRTSVLLQLAVVVVGIDMIRADKLVCFLRGGTTGQNSRTQRRHQQQKTTTIHKHPFTTNIASALNLVRTIRRC